MNWLKNSIPGSPFTKLTKVYSASLGDSQTLDDVFLAISNKSNLFVISLTTYGGIYGMFWVSSVD